MCSPEKKSENENKMQDMPQDIRAKVEQTVSAIRARHDESPRVGVILGSGLGSVVDHLRPSTRLSFTELPHFRQSTVPGHPGFCLLGRMAGVPAVVLQGRVHYYEGYSMEEVVFPVRVLGALGVRELIVTNASGAIDTSMQPGTLMLIKDHINLMGTNPLIGKNIDQWGERFPDMTRAYDPDLRQHARETAEANGIRVCEGVYVAVPGPSFETPAEIRMLRQTGAGAVGMSTVPEVIVANHMNIRVLGLSCVTNMAAGIRPQKLTHDEVIEGTTRFREALATVIEGVIQRLRIRGVGTG